jgi:4-amino-4-deoxy-L-arabinose transferase-like glycosyltransferase
MFLIGWQMRLRSLAYPAALLYALHPVILLNGRRAMMEGSLLLTTLLTICWLLAMIIAEHSATAQGFVRRLSLPVRYAILGVLVGLAVAAKHTGLVVGGAALIGALFAALARDRSWRPLALVGFATAIAFLTWFALNPAYWNNPVGAAQAMLNARADLLQAQTNDAPLAYSDIGQRVGAIVKQSFLTPPQYYESPTWGGLPHLEGQIALYQQSAIDGWDWGPLVGVVLTLLAALGLLALLYDALRRDLVALAILIWAGATIAASLAIPLDWQRYYLPLLLVAIVLAAVGLGRLLVRRTADETRQQTVADAASA